MGGGPQNMNAMIRQAQKMQEDMKAKQEELEQLTFKTTSGGGMVEVTISGKKEVQSIVLQDGGFFELFSSIRRTSKCFRI